MEYALQLERRRRVIRTLPLIALLVPSFAWSQTYIDLPWVLANAMSTNGTANQCWGMDPTGAFQEWITPSGSGGGITSGTGDVTFSGTGSVATTVAKIAGVTVGTPTGTGNVVMSASPTLTGTISAAAETLTGLLTHPNGLVNAPATGFANSSTTGVYAPTGGTIAMAFSGATPTEFGASYISIGKALAGSTPNGNGALYIFEPGSTTNWWAVGAGPNFATANQFFIQRHGLAASFSHNTNGQGSMMFNATGSTGAPEYTFDFNTTSTLTTPSFVGVQNTTVVQSVITLRNGGTTTAGDFSGIISAGDSLQGNAGLFFFNDVNPATTGTEQSHVELWTALAGTKSSTFKITPWGDILTSGTAPTPGSCGTSPSMVSKSTDHSGTITVGSGGTATTCGISWAETLPNAPNCIFSDKTTGGLSFTWTTSVTAATITSTTPFGAGDSIPYICEGNY